MAEEFRIPNLKESAQQAELLNKEFKKTIDILLKVSQEGQKAMSSFRGIGSIKGIQEFEIASKKAVSGVTQAYGKLNSIEKARRDAMVEQERLSLRLLKTQKAQSLETEKLKIQTRELTKASKQAALEELGLVSAYDKVVRKMNEAGKVVQNLNAKRLTGEKLSRQEVNALKRSEKEFLKYNKAVIGADASIKRFQRNVGNYPAQLNAAAGAARNLASAMGLVGGAFLVVRTIGDALRRIREFDKSMQNLAGILQTTRKELKPIESEIIDVAGASIKTSREVATLAESLATLGKRGDDLKNLIEPANDLSIALEASSDEAAEFLVQTLNAFGASSIEASSYASTIAAIRTSTTLDFQRMRDSFQYITPISRILNRDLAYTGALVGLLADNGIKAEQAGRLLASAQLRLSKEGLSLNDAVEILNKSINEGATGQEQLAIATNLVGVNASKVLIPLALNTKALDKNAEAIRNNQTALDDLIGQQLESLDAKIKILDSTYEKLILTIEKGDGKASGFFKGIIGFAEGALSGLTKLLQTQEEYNESIISDVERRKYKETIKLYNDLGDSAERVAIERADRARDEVDSINSQIKALKDRNLLIEKTRDNNPFASSSNEEFDKNNERIADLSSKLGTYNGVLRASEDFLEGVTEQVKENTDAKKENEDATKKLLETDLKTITPREKITPINLKTAEELKSEFQDYAKKVMAVLEENFGVEAGKIDPIELPPLDSEEFEAGLTRLQELTNDFITNLSFKSIEDSPLSSLKTFFDGTFEDLILGADTLAEEFAITFNAIGEVAKDTFSLLNELGQDNFEQQLNLLAKEKEVSLLFAGDSVAAKKRIEDQYEERRTKIQAKQAKAQKDQALFNAGVTTFQSALAAYSSQLIPGDPTSIVRAKIAAAVATSFGLLQTGLIASQEIPAFWTGTESTPAGEIMVNDDPYGIKGNNYKEVIKEPSGKLHFPQGKNVKMNVPKGSTVFPNYDMFNADLDNILNSSGIIPFSSQLEQQTPIISVNNTGATASEIDSVMGKYFSNLQVNQTIIDKNGIRTLISKGNSKTVIHNNRVSGKGFSV